MAKEATVSEDLAKKFATEKETPYTRWVQSEGLEIIGHVREQCPWTKTILLTAHWSPEVEKEARSRGVVAFLQKPMPLQELAQIVHSVLERPS